MELSYLLKLPLLMENENNGSIDTSNQLEEVVLETTHEEEIVENSNELAEKLAKAEELANNYKIRAEKAEKLAKQVKFAEPQVSTKIVGGDLTTKDLYALMDAKVAQEDVEEVSKIAKLYGISIPEAIKLPLTKTFLSEKAEQRQTASAANVGSSKRSSGKTPDDVLLSKAEKGELPENDADLARLISLRKGK